MHSTHHLRGPEQHAYAGPASQRPGGTRLEQNLDVEGRGRRPRKFVRDEDITPRDGGPVDACDAHGRSRSGLTMAHLLPIALEGAHPAPQSGWKDQDGIADVQSAGPGGAGDNRSDTGKREDPVDRHPERIARRAWTECGRAGCQALSQLVQA